MNWDPISSNQDPIPSNQVPISINSVPMSMNLQQTPPITSSTGQTRSNLYENPYDLHHSDHAGLVLVSDRLTMASEFHSWRRSIWMALNVRNKLGFIDGTIPKPPSTHKDYGAWSRCNDIVATWLMNSVSKKIGQSLLFINTAEGIWKNLLTRFKQDDAPRVYDIEQRLNKIEQGSNDVTTYYTELLTLWEEYKNYVELPVCSCGRCECEAAAKWEKLQQRSQVTRFLMGLNESYEQSRRHILMLKPIPTIEEVYNMVTQDERQTTIRPATKIDNVAFQTVAPMSTDADNGLIAAYNTARPPQKPMCTHCGKVGHTVQKCFKLHGFPPGYKGPATGYRPAVQNQLQARMAMMQQPRMPVSFQPQQPQMQMIPYGNMQRANAIANVYAETGSYPAQPGYYSYEAPASVPQVQDFTQQQLQQFLSQMTTQATVQETVPTSNTNQSIAATVTGSGFMAEASTSGTFSGLDDWEG